MNCSLDLMRLGSPPEAQKHWNSLDIETNSQSSYCVQGTSWRRWNIDIPQEFQRIFLHVEASWKPFWWPIDIAETFKKTRNSN